MINIIVVKMDHSQGQGQDQVIILVEVQGIVVYKE